MQHAYYVAYTGVICPAKSLQIRVNIHSARLILAEKATEMKR